MIAAKPRRQESKQLKTLNLGFLGLGWIGLNRMQALLQNPKVNAAAIVEPVAENFAKALDCASGVQQVTSAEELYDLDSLDGIVIATPSAMHARQSIEVLNAGKAVFCQKPLGRTAQEVQSVTEAAREADKVLGVDFSYRYTEAFQAVYKQVKGGNIGEVYAVNLVFHNAYGPDKDWFYDIVKSGGGCVMDLGIHMIDLALWTLGFPKINEVRSHLFRHGKKMQRADEVEDFASATLMTEEDTLINLQCSWNLPAGQEAVIEATFFGVQGAVSFKNVNGSFFDFTAQKQEGTQTQTLVSPPDQWSGRAGSVWAERVLNGEGFDADSALELIRTAEVIDRIYDR